MAVRTRWLAGPATSWGPVLVGVTDFTAASALALPEHVAIMRRYRGRGEIRSVASEADAFDPAAAWARAARVLAGADSRAGQAGAAAEAPSQREPR